MCKRIFYCIDSAQNISGNRYSNYKEVDIVENINANTNRNDGSQSYIFLNIKLPYFCLIVV